MVGHGRSSAGSYLADPTSPIPSHCASIATTSTVRVKQAAVVHYLDVADVCALAVDQSEGQDISGGMLLCLLFGISTGSLKTNPYSSGLSGGPKPLNIDLNSP